MTLDEAIGQVCDTVGIKPPRYHKQGRWVRTDTFNKNGKSDGSIIVNPTAVSARNWQTGEIATVHLKDERTFVERKEDREKQERDEREKRARADRSAKVAQKMVGAATVGTHPYLAAKGFPSEKALVLDADAVAHFDQANIREMNFNYLVPKGAGRALLMPAKIGAAVSTIQLIWEDGTKKFLRGGHFDGACHRIAKGADTWLCEGLATGLSLRAALKSLNRSDTILCCFSASNVASVARSIEGRVFIAADNDKPMEQFGGLGTGEHYAKATGRPYTMPPAFGDFNDWHTAEGIFALQRHLARFIREARR